MGYFWHSLRTGFILATDLISENPQLKSIRKKIKPSPEKWNRKIVLKESGQAKILQNKRYTSTKNSSNFDQEQLKTNIQSIAEQNYSRRTQ